MFSNSYCGFIPAAGLISRPVIKSVKPSQGDKKSKQSIVVRPLLFVIIALLISSLVVAQDEELIEFDIRATQLSKAMDRLAEQANVQLMYRYHLANTSGLNPVVGKYTIREALQIMFHDTSFLAGLTEDGIVTVSLNQSKIDREREAEMKKTKKGLLASLIGFLSASGAVGVSAQGAVQEDVGEFLLEEIVVTANRREQALKDVTMSVSSVDPNDFTEIGLTSIGGMLDYTPGVNFSGNGPRGRGEITARGVSQEGNTAVVAIYLDDVPVTASGPFGQGNIILLDAVSADLERIEILRGPQGTLYGATAIGGAIKYVTRKPSTDELRGKLSLSYSGIKEGGNNKNYNGFVSVPLIEDTLGLTLSGFKENNDGFVDQVDGAGQVVAEDVDSSETAGYSADLFWNVTESSSLRFKYLNQITDHGIESSVNLDGATLKPLNDHYQTTAQVGQIETEYDTYNITLESDLGFADLTATSSVVEQQNASIRDFTTAGLSPGATFVGSSIEAEYEKVSHEIRLTSSGDENFAWMLGVIAVDEDSQGGQVVTATHTEAPTTRDILTFLRQASYEELAVYGNYTYMFSDNFDVTVGARLSDHEIKVNQVATGAFGGAFSIPLDIEFPDNSDTVDSYSIEAGYRPSDEVSYYARIASGYRPASTNVPVVVGGVNVAPKEIESDELWSYELGAKGSLGDTFEYDVAVWFLDWDNFQTGFAIANTSVLTNAAGGIQAQGFDGAFTWRPFGGFSLATTLSYIDSTLNDDEPLINGASGQNVTGLPKLSGSMHARYDFPLTSDWGGFVNAGFRYKDRLPSAYQAGTGTLTSINLPSNSFSQWDMSAGLSSDVFTATLFVTNLFDKVAYTAASADLSLTAFDFSTSPPTPVFSEVGGGFPVQPRTVGLSASYNF
jgi:outer membrane receptor protein involved in Fe transport